MEQARQLKRILSLDGGGLRGVATIAFLERLERRLTAEQGRPIAFYEHFDLIGGVSTGAIIATALALGQSLAQIKDHYFRLGPNVFQRARSRIPFVHALFSGKALERELLSIVGERTLGSPDLKTKIAIIAKRIDTGSVWFMTNNPKARYWNDSNNRNYVRNRDISLASLIRASAAAPHYFAPKRIRMTKAGFAGLFVDGGVTPHSNPALAMFLIATIPAYGFGWQVGAETLEITSVGTGSFSRVLDRNTWFPRLSARISYFALRSMIDDADEQVMTLMQALGRTETPWIINSEIDDLGGVCIATEPLFTFRRYNLLLERDWIKQELDQEITEVDLETLRGIDDPKLMQPIYDLAQIAAAKQIPVT